MALDGTWALTVDSPMGKQKSKLEVTTDGGVATGTSYSPQGEGTPIKDGKVDGDEASWSIDIKNPMPMTLSFACTVSGDSLEGKVQAGAFGSFPFNGERA